MNEWWSTILLFFGYFLIYYMIFVIVVYTWMLVLSLLKLRKEYQLDKEELDDDFLTSYYSKPVSILVPAYNEEMGVVDSVRSLLSLRYPQYEVIVINDGSSDRTKEVMLSYFAMEPLNRVIRKQLPNEPIHGVYQSTIHPNLIFVDKQNGGKADALNAGINVSHFPYICSIDGDSILEERSLLRIMKPIISSNGNVIAAGGNVRIANGIYVEYGAITPSVLPNSFLVVMQAVEYLRAFLMGRIALSKYNLVLIISGAFSVFSKDWVIRAGGYAKNTIGEDMELVVRLHRYLADHDAKKRIEFVPDPVCWTEVPSSLSDLRKQRRRWHQGLIESLWKHKKMTFNPKYGAIGMFSMPYFWLIEFLGPLIEIGGYIYLVFAIFAGEVYIEIAILLASLLLLYGSVFSMASVLMEAWSVSRYPRFHDLFRLLLMALTEIFWYRPLTLCWRLEGLIRTLAKKQEWGKMERTGFQRKEEPK